MYCDNRSCIQIAINPKLTNQNKHIRLSTTLYEISRNERAQASLYFNNYNVGWLSYTQKMLVAQIYIYNEEKTQNINIIGKVLRYNININIYISK